MSKFAYTSYKKNKYLQAFLSGAECNRIKFLDYDKIVDDIIIDMCPYMTSLTINIIKFLLLSDALDSMIYQIHHLIPIILING